MNLVMTADELLAFLAAAFPQSEPGAFAIDSVTRGVLRLRFRTDERHLRPGGTVSGPTLMAVADTAMYLLVLAHIGPVALAVTTNLAINFLRKPAALRPLIADARLLKLGKRLAVGDVLLTSDGNDEPVAHVQATYSLPSDGGTR